jgi:hypothetical protein
LEFAGLGIQVDLGKDKQQQFLGHGEEPLQPPIHLKRSPIIIIISIRSHGVSLSLFVGGVCYLTKRIFRADGRNLLRFFIYKSGAAG